MFTKEEEVLQKCTVEGTVVKLPAEQLERKVYQEVQKALELIGGKWKGGKVYGFVFATDPTELLSQIANGEQRNLKKEFQFFATPEKIARRLVQLLEADEADTILEPSAGQGALIKALAEAVHVVPDCYELMDVNIAVLQKSGLAFNLLGEDFLQHKGKPYTKIIANPPFIKNQDMDQVMKMWECLEPGGRIVTITSESWVEGGQHPTPPHRRDRPHRIHRGKPTQARPNAKARRRPHPSFQTWAITGSFSDSHRRGRGDGGEGPRGVGEEAGQEAI